MTAISDILSQRISDVKETPPLPIGTYTATITGIPKIDNFGKKQNLGAEFSFKINAPQGDVDQEEFIAAGGAPDSPLTYTFWLTPKALPMLTAFLKDVLVISADESIRDALPQVAGAQCLVVIEHNDWKNRTLAKIESFAKLD